MAGSADPFVRSGMAVLLAKRLREAVARVGLEEFRGQDDRFDHHSRLGRELLYLASNDEWIRATRETVTLEAADTVATTVQLHVDIGRIQHETFRNRQERLWLPLVVLPPPAEPGPDDLPGVATTPLAGDQSGNALPVLPQAEARRWIAAALAEIILNMAPLHMTPPRLAPPRRPIARELAREQRLLLSAALYRLLQRRAGAGEFRAHPGGGGLDPDGPMEAARARLAKMLDLVISTLQGGGREVASGRFALSGRDRADVADRAALVMQRAARIVYAVSSPTTLVVVAAPPTALSTTYTVELPSRPLLSKVPRWRGPRARISIDALLPGTEADRSIVVRLPEGVSFTGLDGDQVRPRSVRATVEGVQPRSLRQVVDLIGQLRQTRGLLPDPVARCLVDFTLSRMETARDAFRHYRTTPEAARTGEAGQVDSVPAWLDDVRHGLEKIRAEGNGSAAEQAREAAELAPPDLTDTDTLYRINDGAAVSPHRAHIQLTAVENRTVRATPVAATLDLDVVADRSAPLHAARYSGYMSLLLLTAVMLSWLVIKRPAGVQPDDFPDAQVLGSVLTLFAAVQASRIQHPERATLRGLLISSGSWLVIASILPTVLLGVILAFNHSSTQIVIAAVVLQAAVQLLMYLPPLTGQPWRWRAVGLNLVARPPRLRLWTGPTPDYRRTAVLLSSWWRSTTAAALQLGTEAYGYVVPQQDAGVLDLLGHGAGSAPTTSGGVLTGGGPAGNSGAAGGNGGNGGNGGGPVGNGGGPAGNGHGGGPAASAPTANRRGVTARAPWVNRGLGLLATRLPKAITALTEEPQQPANILALLRAGAPGRTVTFIVFREEPQPEWQQQTRVSVDLDIDRLIAQEAPITELDVYIGLAGTGLRTIEHHPVRRFLALARHRRLQIPSLQFPAAPPPGGAADRHWTKITIGLRSSEVSGLGGLLCGVLDRVKDDSGEAVDLFVDMSTQTPPRRFLGPVQQPAGRPGPEETRPAVPMPPSGLDVPNSLDDAGGEWLTLALCDYAKDGGEARLLRVLERDYPGLELGGLTIARLFGTTVVVALGRRGEVPRRGSRRPDATRPDASRSGQRVLVQDSATVQELGGLPAEGVLLEVRARYSDRPGIFTELLEILRRTLTGTVGLAFDATDMHILHLNTDVADGRNADTSFTLSLPGPASGAHFTPDVLDRVEREARRALLTLPPTDPAGDDLGLVHAPRVAIHIELVTVQAVTAPAPGPVIDLTAAESPVPDSPATDGL